MLDLDPTRDGAVPRDAATLLLVRDADGPTIQVYAVVRHQKSGFLGGAVVFPGGKVDPADHDPAWTALATPATLFTPDDDPARARAFGVAACREAFEEAALLLTAEGGVSHERAVALRAGAAPSFRETLAREGLSLDLGLLHPFGRWITPIAESRRFDTRFFLAVAPRGQLGEHDSRETTSGFWASPREILDRFERGEIQLAPPTHRCLELLVPVSSAAGAIELARGLGREPVCPKLVAVAAESTLALVLPGDPEHDVAESRVPGASRFVLRGERWLPESAGRGERTPTA